ncbi:MAG: DNA repair protein RecN, partial [Bacteroidaceae bacterium]
EQEELEQEADTLSHAEEIKAGLYQIDQTLMGDERNLLSMVKDNVTLLRSLQKVYQPANELCERLESNYIELKDIAQEISSRQEEVEFNPSRLEFVNERLNLIYSLEQKHRVQT